MKLYEITIRPVSGFGTPLKGDTLFGHFCWQAAYDASILNGGLNQWIACYAEKPCAVFSTAWPKLRDKDRFYYAVKRPDLPLSRLFPSRAVDKKTAMMERKENAEKKWMLISEDLRISLFPEMFKNDSDIIEMAGKDLADETRKALRGSPQKALVEDFHQPHNSINRMTDTTGEGKFAPYEQNAGYYYYPETELAVFALIDEDATDIRRVGLAMERIGKSGFGRDSSTGLGRYEMGGMQQRQIPAAAGACYTLAPSIPETGVYRDCYFTPFTRFGRHGDFLARSANPFKNPVIMADEGAVLIPKDKGKKATPYLGRPGVNVSKIMPETVVQGYAPWLPLTWEIE